MRNIFMGCAALLLASTLLSGCGVYLVDEFTPPTSQNGLSCVRKCEGALRGCLHRADQNYKTEDYKYKNDVDSYDRCTATRSRKDGYRDCKLPRPAPEDKQYACSDPHRACYQGCGGTIKKVPFTFGEL